METVNQLKVSGKEYAQKKKTSVEKLQKILYELGFSRYAAPLYVVIVIFGKRILAEKEI